MDVVPFHRTAQELAAYVKRLEALAWQLVGDEDEYEALMEDGKAAGATYVKALELLILSKSGGAD